MNVNAALHGDAAPAAALETANRQINSVLPRK